MGTFLENMSPYILNLCYKGHLIGLGGGGRKWAKMALMDQNGPLDTFWTFPLRKTKK